jgi:hypothetical protein
MVKKLHIADSRPHSVDYFHPRILPRAGHSMSVEGILDMLDKAIESYTQEFPDSVMGAEWREYYLNALVNNE